MKPWTGDISISGSTPIKDVRVAQSDGAALAHNATLTLLSPVDIAHVPLHIICSPPTDVTTSSEATAAWFSQLLCKGPNTTTEWWNSAALQSEAGFLARIDGAKGGNPGQINPTEVLFFASRSSPTNGLPSPPRSSENQPAQDERPISIKAILLSSDLLTVDVSATQLTPPPSPRPADSFIEGAFVLNPDASATSNKRKSLSDTFDEASKRRRLAKKGIKPGDLTDSAQSQVASIIPSSSLHKFSTSNLQDKRPLSRAASLQVSKSRSQSPAPRPTTSHAEAKIPSNPIEQRNKDLVSRLILAGMRLHGLSQTKSKTISRTEEEKAADEEFKLIYHNTLKAISFAFRASIGSTDLKPHTVLVQEKMETMLTLFCSDPLSQPGFGMEDMTPSGRTPFKTPTMQQGGAAGFPFPASVEKVVESSPAQQIMARGLNISVPVVGTSDGRTGQREGEGEMTGKAPVQPAAQSGRKRAPGF
ncbi:hypothetical protein BDZ85DRAFT_227037 [Elsinoe ampelina]|uniref:Sld7 C-terminal domain-containing protein n=1 Tax=Elsinoe ampelina TaxID=302913 RepID=A0A6A6FY02_9PEZI|nr:hypothetical protein BDZ85DRAFT_227037 [Elsinoe ampelina]